MNLTSQPFPSPPARPPRQRSARAAARNRRADAHPRAAHPEQPADGAAAGNRQLGSARPKVRPQDGGKPVGYCDRRAVPDRHQPRARVHQNRGVQDVS